jgi:PASTA domain
VLLGIGVPLLVCPLLMAGSAKGATLVLGSQFQGAIDGAPVPSASTGAQATLPAPLLAASPTDGTVIDWRFVGAGAGFVPRIIRPAGGGQYIGAGTGSAQTGNAPAIAGPFTVSLPIRKGDLFGFDAQAGTDIGVIDRPGTGYIAFTPPLPDGGSPQPPGAQPARELAVSATVRYCLVPKLKGKKPAAARDALTAADCTVGKTKKSKKRRKRKRVLSQSVAPGTSISDTQPVDIKVSRKR